MDFFHGRGEGEAGRGPLAARCWPPAAGGCGGLRGPGAMRGTALPARPWPAEVRRDARRALRFAEVFNQKTQQRDTEYGNGADTCRKLLFFLLKNNSD